MKVTPERKAWATSRGAIMRGLPLRPPQQAERLYQRALQRAVERMTKAYQREVQRTLRPFLVAQDQGVAMDADHVNAGAAFASMFSRLDKYWGQFFGKLARTLATTTVKRIDRMSRKSLDESLKVLSGGMTIKTPKLPKGMVSSLQMATARNVGLIKSIQSKYHEQIEQTVMNSLGDAQAIYDNAKEVVHRTYYYGETTKERARLIARDQVSKLNSALSAERAEAAGMTHFEWRHSGGSADPRILHLQYDRQIFRYDDLPVIDERTGERGLPGQAINCRCVAVPILNFGDDD